jgi:hypothetical protein
VRAVLLLRHHLVCHVRPLKRPGMVLSLAAQMHRFCIPHQITGCAPIAATDNIRVVWSPANVLVEARLSSLALEEAHFPTFTWAESRLSLLLLLVVSPCHQDMHLHFHGGQLCQVRWERQRLRVHRVGLLPPLTLTVQTSPDARSHAPPTPFLVSTCQPGGRSAGPDLHPVHGRPLHERRPQRPGLLPHRCQGRLLQRQVPGGSSSLSSSSSSSPSSPSSSSSSSSASLWIIAGNPL